MFLEQRCSQNSHVRMEYWFSNCCAAVKWVVLGEQGESKLRCVAGRLCFGSAEHTQSVNVGNWAKGGRWNLFVVWHRHREGKWDSPVGQPYSLTKHKTALWLQTLGLQPGREQIAEQRHLMQWSPGGGCCSPSALPGLLGLSRAGQHWLLLTHTQRKGFVLPWCLFAAYGHSLVQPWGDESALCSWNLHTMGTRGVPGEKDIPGKGAHSGTEVNWTSLAFPLKPLVMHFGKWNAVPVVKSLSQRIFLRQ